AATARKAAAKRFRSKTNSPPRRSSTRNGRSGRISGGSYSHSQSDAPNLICRPERSEGPAFACSAKRFLVLDVVCGPASRAFADIVALLAKAGPFASLRTTIAKSAKKSCKSRPEISAQPSPLCDELLDVLLGRQAEVRCLRGVIGDQFVITCFHQTHRLHDGFGGKIFRARHNVFQRVLRIDSISLLNQNRAVVELCVDEVNADATLFLAIRQCPEAGHETAILGQQRAVAIHDAFRRL